MSRNVKLLFCRKKQPDLKVNYELNMLLYEPIRSELITLVNEKGRTSGLQKIVYYPSFYTDEEQPEILLSKDAFGDEIKFLELEDLYNLVVRIESSFHYDLIAIKGFILGLPGGASLHPGYFVGCYFY